ncbi:MAG: ATP-dependent helicase [Candidatus Kapabacteria bacterium]|nr:ATP-dependent helicase [Candidatus Kapabacteria bacterium]
MQKLVLKKSSSVAQQKRTYKINYGKELNAAQYDAVMHTDGAALVIAGAGTGKTRILVYRVARLIEDSIPPESIVLLTFTRKSAQEMLRRSALLIDNRCERIQGGTFHSYSASLLRRYAPIVGFERNFSIIDQSDAEDIIQILRMNRGLDSSKRRFPQKKTIHSIISAAINTCKPLLDVIESDYPQYTDDAETINNLARDYHTYKAKNNVLDYDDLLVYANQLLFANSPVRAEIQRKARYIMVDEYQDTNPLQHQIVTALAEGQENVMAVGDDAQSIYSFRGASFENIMLFPKSFSSCRIIAIEENYRSTQPLLDCTNAIMKQTAFRYEKNLYSTMHPNGDKPALVQAEDEVVQAQFIVQQILELHEQGIPLKGIAVLFRSSYHSYDLEIELNKANIPFVKFGGLKLMETAHIKDVLAYARVLVNPTDMIAWNRLLMLVDGVGPRTAARIIEAMERSEISTAHHSAISSVCNGKSAVGVERLMKFIYSLSTGNTQVQDLVASIAEFYRPTLKENFDDYEKRWKDIDVVIGIAERYETLQNFIADILLEPPVNSVAELEAESPESDLLTLSTIHSAKGLEWHTVFVITVLEGRFPSAKSVVSLDSLEEERRLLYVACTRAKRLLYMSYPTNIYDRESGFVLSKPSRFVSAIDDAVLDRFTIAKEDEDDTAVRGLLE